MNFMFFSAFFLNDEIMAQRNKICKQKSKKN